MIGLDFSTMREAMVSSQLRTNEVSNPRVVDAILGVKRERFVPARRSSVAYTDLPIPLGGGRSLNAPLATARLISEALPVAGESILLVGAATGYSAAILNQMGCDVTALEADETLIVMTKENLSDATGISLVAGPLAEGWAAGAPYDVIIFDGAIEALPQAIIDQCADGGRVAAAVIDGGVVRLARGFKAAGHIVMIPFAECQSIVLPGFSAAKEFVF